MSTPPEEPDQTQRPPVRPWGWRQLVLLLASVVLLNLIIASLLHPAVQRVRIPYRPVFVEQVEKGNVRSIDSRGTTIKGTFWKPVAEPAGATARRDFETEVPSYANPDTLDALLAQHDVVVNAKPADDRSFVGTLLLTFLPVLLIIGFFFWMMRRAAGGGPLTSFARSRARRAEPSEQRITFDDIAGVDEAEAELAEIVDFLREPAKYRRLGGRIPRGVLLVGPPGTGKTLLARAMAGEAGVPFFSIAASEFVELFVGVGASRVRDLFAEAKQAAPAIVFIDELDAIGRARGPGSFSGGHEEREQTLNQILAEMDGFDPSIGVIVLAATNRPEVLDKALLRPGRFDRRVALEPPDTAGRRAILGVHTRSVPLADDADLDRLAAETPGMVGAELANVVNEGALIAARRGEDAVSMHDLEEAIERLVLGSERRILVTPEERRRTAFHEAGHAVVGMLTPGADPVRKVSIIPHGKALGVTLASPSIDRFNYDAAYLRGKIDVMLAGQAAEQLVFGEVSTGAENDLHQATEIVRHMAGSWGMSDAVGPMTVLHDPDEAIAYPLSSEVSEETQRLLDGEVRRILKDERQRVDAILAEHRDALDGLAEALIVHETLDEAATHAAAGLPPADAVDREVTSA